MERTCREDCDGNPAGVQGGGIIRRGLGDVASRRESMLRSFFRRKPPRAENARSPAPDWKDVAEVAWTEAARTAMVERRRVENESLVASLARLLGAA